MKSSDPATKRQKIPSTTGSRLASGVWVVATPIGNLSDISERAKQVLSSADWIACEDTRRTRSLLSALGISSLGEAGRDRLRRFDRHSSEGVADSWVREIQRVGESVALVSDAGTPGVSDPGALLVSKAYELDIPIFPVPGASAVTTLISACGWEDADSFCFQGFLPRTSSEIAESLERTIQFAHQTGRSWIAVWFESPERLKQSLGVFTEASTPHIGVELLVGKELTKLYERFFRGDPSEVLKKVSEEITREGPLGEWVIAMKIPRLNADDPEEAHEPGAWGLALECLLEAGVKASESSRILSHRFGVSREIVYDRALVLKKNGGRG